MHNEYIKMPSSISRINISKTLTKSTYELAKNKFEVISVFDEQIKYFDLAYSFCLNKIQTAQVDYK